jgi:hypothetical protein
VMVKTNWASDLNAQQISRLNEHILVVDSIWKAGWNTPQGNGLLQNKLLNLSGDDGASALFPSLNLRGLALADWFASLLAQNDRAFWSMTSLLAPKSLPLKDPQYGSSALADSAALGRSALWSQHGGAKKAT